MIMKLFALFHEPKASLMHVENYNCVYLFEKISHSLGRQLLIVIRFNVKIPNKCQTFLCPSDAIRTVPFLLPLSSINQIELSFRLFLPRARHFLVMNLKFPADHQNKSALTV